MMKRVFVSAALAGLFGLSAVSARAQDRNPAANNPDRFAWEQLFVPINKASGTGQNTVWESWASDEDTFPVNPDPKQPPSWPGTVTKNLRTARQQRMLTTIRRRELEDQGLIQPNGPSPQIATSGDQQEVRRNRAAFDFIAKNGLYYQQGLVAAFRQNKRISFPLDAIEIKANWKQIAETDKPQYHWNIDASGRLFGLVALHISSKDLPNWVWATFEHRDNPDRCKALGCKDSFGLTADGKVSKQLIDVFQANGLGKEWQNYRLNGVQVDFVDATGMPTLLGNSITERGFVESSSCITCHARATVNGSGRSLSVFTPDGQSNNGAPDPKWFFSPAATPKPLFLQLDFVWAFLAANPAPNP